MLPLIDDTQSPVRLPGATESRIFMYAFCNASCIADWKTEAESKGFANRMVSYACDEPYQAAANWTTCRNNINSARTTWPAVPTALTGTINDANQLAVRIRRCAIWSTTSFQRVRDARQAE